MKTLDNGTRFGLFALLGIAAISCAQEGTGSGDPGARSGSGDPGARTGTATESEPDCTPHEEPCETSRQCCSNNCEDGICQPHCKGFQRICASNEECCSGLCSAGRCRAI